MRPALVIPEFYIDDTFPTIRLIDAKNKQVLFNLILLSIIQPCIIYFPPTRKLFNQ